MTVAQGETRGENVALAALGETPGQILRRAREAAGLSVADIAQQTKFSVRQVEALEADNYAALPDAPIVRGFVRSYARLLKLDIHPLLAALDRVVPIIAPDVREPENMGLASPSSGLRTSSWLVAFSVVLIGAAVLIAGWHFWGERLLIGSAPAGPGNGANAAMSAGSAARALSTAAQEEAPTHGPKLSDAETAAATAQAIVMPPLPTMAEGKPAADATQTTAQANAGERRLSFVLHGKAWIEVRDAHQRILLTGEHAAGTRPAVIGRPPFQLVIGNAARVELYDGEQRIDLVPHTRAEVARLRLD